MKKILLTSLAWVLTTTATFAAINAAALKENVDSEALMEKKEAISEVVESKAEVVSEIVFENKDKAVEKIDKFIAALEKVSQEVNDSAASDETKTETMIAINKAIAFLEEIKVQIEQAESAEDVQKIISESTAELKALKEEIKEALLDLKSELQNISAEQISQAIDEIEQILRLLKVVCPAQTEAIATIEGNLSELEELLIVLNDAIKAEDYAVAKQAIVDSNELIIETTLAIQDLSEGCLY